MAEREYRRTFLDRHGADGAILMKAMGYSLVSMPLAFIIMGEAARRIGASGPVTFAMILVGIVVAYLVSVYSSLAIIRMGASPMARIYGGSNTTPYEEQYSQEQALVMQRRLDEALALYEHRIATEPGNAAARIRAADLYAGEGANPSRAAELFREVQRIPGVAAKDGVYACNRLADLYLGPLAEPGRAIVELRKLIDLYPGTPGAAQARIALAELKARLHAGSQDANT